MPIGKKKKQKSEAVSTFLGADSKVEGLIEFQGTIRLDGHVKGKIISEDGMLIIGEKAVIDAQVIVYSAIIMGEVTGKVYARERIEVYPPARIFGDIQAPSIMIDNGAVLNGICEMKAPDINILGGEINGNSSDTP